MSKVRFAESHIVFLIPPMPGCLRADAWTSLLDLPGPRARAFFVLRSGSKRQAWPDDRPSELESAPCFLRMAKSQKDLRMAELNEVSLRPRASKAIRFGKDPGEIVEGVFPVPACDRAKRPRHRRHQIARKPVRCLRQNRQPLTFARHGVCERRVKIGKALARKREVL